MKPKRRGEAWPGYVGRALAPYGVEIGSHWRILTACNPLSEFKLQDDPIFGYDGNVSPPNAGDHFRMDIERH